MKVLLIGVGYWGSKILERLKRLPSAPEVVAADPKLTAVCLERPHVLELLRGSVAFEDYQDALKMNPGIDACIVATPMSTHYTIVKACLEAGKHVLVEKPMAKTGQEARELVDLAFTKGLVLRTDLTFLEHPLVKGLAGADIPGMVWTGPKSPRSDEGLLWTWAPHPVSIMLYAHRGQKPDRLGDRSAVEEGGESYTLDYDFPDGTWTIVRMAWGNFRSMRRLDVKDPDRLLDLTPIPQPEPLAQVLKHFLQAVKKHDTTPDWIGLKTVEVLEWTQLSKSPS